MVRLIAVSAHEPRARRAAILAAGSAGILARRTLGRQGCRPNRQAGSLPYFGASRFMAPIHVRVLEVFALHEPGRASVLASPNFCPLEIRARRSLAPPFMAQPNPRSA